MIFVKNDIILIHSAMECSNIYVYMYKSLSELKVINVHRSHEDTFSVCMYVCLCSMFLFVNACQNDLVRKFEKYSVF